MCVALDTLYHWVTHLVTHLLEDNICTWRKTSGLEGKHLDLKDSLLTWKTISGLEGQHFNLETSICNWREIFCLWGHHLDLEEIWRTTSGLGGQHLDLRGKPTCAYYTNWCHFSNNLSDTVRHIVKQTYVQCTLTLPFWIMCMAFSLSRGLHNKLRLVDMSSDLI